VSFDRFLAQVQLRCNFLVIPTPDDYSSSQIRWPVSGLLELSIVVRRSGLMEIEK